jgi:hypothetical protein
VHGLDNDALTLEPTARIRLGTVLPDGDIRYTTNGSDPTATSALYTGPIEVAVPDTGVVVTARVFTA